MNGKSRINDTDMTLWLNDKLKEIKELQNAYWDLSREQLNNRDKLIPVAQAIAIGHVLDVLEYKEELPDLDKLIDELED